MEPGVEGLCELAASRDVDVVLLALSGGLGFAPLLTALKAGKTVALADNEPMVMAGERFAAEADRWGGRIIPIDPVPSALLECLEARARRPGAMRGYGKLVRRVVITVAPAKPARTGGRAAVDRATLMAKGLEAIAIQGLCGLGAGQIEVVLHPQSVLRSAVEFPDGTVLAQLGAPGARLPLQHALTWPERAASPARPLDLLKVKALTFAAPDFRRFPCLELALEAARAGGSHPAVLNAADAVAVEAFLAGRIRVTDIARVVAATLKRHRGAARLPSFAEVLETDQWARAKAEELVEVMD